MYNPDQYYKAHTLRLKELSAQAEQHRMIAAYPRHRKAIEWFGMFLVTLGTWLTRTARREKQPA
jgi:hypothetical protein